MATREEQNPARTAYLDKRIAELRAQGLEQHIIAERLGCSSNVVGHRLRRGNSERWLKSPPPAQLPAEAQTERREYQPSVEMMRLYSLCLEYRRIPSLADG